MIVKKIIILPFAEVDIKESVSFYREENEKIAMAFLKCLDEAFRLILRNPETYPLVKFNIRKVVLGKFPFGIFYVLSEGTIYILAVFHEKRNPDLLKKRRMGKH
jgi:toxin ParE1/3/4